jgi:hypothetical protein
MLTNHFSNLYLKPSNAIVKKLLGFKVDPIIPQQHQQQHSNDPNNFNSKTTSYNITNGNESSSSLSSDTMQSITAKISNGSSSTSTTTTTTTTTTTSSSTAAIQLNNHNKFCEKNIRAFVKKLKKASGDLEELEKAITSKNPATKCILMSPKSNNDSNHRTVSRRSMPPMIACRIWRWPDLQNPSELRSIPEYCKYGAKHSMNSDSDLVCINPYHYTRQLTVYLPKSSLIEEEEGEFNNNYKDEYTLKQITSETSSSSSPIGYYPQQNKTETINNYNSNDTLNYQLPPIIDLPIQTNSAVASNPKLSNSNVRPPSTPLSNAPLTPSSSASPQLYLPPPPPQSSSNNQFSNQQQQQHLVRSPPSVNSQISSPGSYPINQILSPLISEDEGSEINDLSDFNDIELPYFNGELTFIFDIVCRFFNDSFFFRFNSSDNGATIPLVYNNLL